MGPVALVILVTATCTDRPVAAVMVDWTTAAVASQEIVTFCRA